MLEASTRSFLFFYIGGFVKPRKLPPLRLDPTTFEETAFAGSLLRSSKSLGVC
jgi:hypothetical protein